MESWRRFSFALVVVLATALLAGAGSAVAKTSPKAAFNAKVRAVGTQAQQALLAMPTQVDPSPADEAAGAGELQAIYQRVARRLGAMTPPKAIKADFRLLVLSYQVAARNAGAWQDALLHGTPQQAAAAARRLHLNPAEYRASAALVRMSEHGYYFGTFFR